MNAQTIRFLPVLRGYMKVSIPLIAIFLSLASSSLALADGAEQAANVHVWDPWGTQSIKIACNGCDGHPAPTCFNNVPWFSPLEDSGYHDFGWQGQINKGLSITAYNQPNCSHHDALDTASSVISSSGDCWFDLPRQNVSGVCNGTTDAQQN